MLILFMFGFACFSLGLASSAHLTEHYFIKPMEKKLNKLKKRDKARAQVVKLLLMKNELDEGEQKKKFPKDENGNIISPIQTGREGS